MRDLSCDVIRDLLPAVADEIASADTEALVKEHIATCANCRAALAAMRAPSPAPTADEREIDYLKKTRKKGLRAVIAAALAVLMLCAAGLALRAFVIGFDGDPAWLMSEVEAEGSALTLRCSPNDSAGAVGKMEFADEDGVVTVNARRVLVSPLHRGGAEATYEASEPIRRVIVNGRVVWDEGARISPYTAKLFSFRNPYVGDASADMALLRALLEGDYTIELQTEAEPYGMTVRLPERQPGEIESLQPMLQRAGCVLLALTENLGEVQFTFGDENADPIRVTEADASYALSAINVPLTTGVQIDVDPLDPPADPETAFLPELTQDIKTCYDSPVRLEMLLYGLQLRGPIYADLGSAREHTVTIRNGTDLSIQSMTLEQWFAGSLRSSESGMYADESAITRGNALDFSVPTLPQYGELRLTFTTESGQTYTAEGFDAGAEALTIIGNVGEGFKLIP